MTGTIRRLQGTVDGFSKPVGVIFGDVIEGTELNCFNDVVFSRFGGKENEGDLRGNAGGHFHGVQASEARNVGIGNDEVDCPGEQKLGEFLSCIDRPDDGLDTSANQDEFGLFQIPGMRGEMNNPHKAVASKRDRSFLRRRKTYFLHDGIWHKKGDRQGR